MNYSSFIFAHRVKAKLRKGSVSAPDARHFVVTGKVNTPAVLASVEVVVARDFDELLHWPPQVTCLEPWMRVGSDWHNAGAAGGMCWVLGDEWRDVLRPEGRLPRDLVRVASTWLINNVTSLISRHYYAHLVQMKQWPTKWDAWAHYKEGSEEYEREQRRNAALTM